MDKFKKIFRIQLIVLPLLALLGIIIGTIIHEVSESGYQEISGKEFIRIAVKYEITNYDRSGNRFEMETPSGKYSHDFGFEEEALLQDTILEKFSSFGWHDIIPFYEVGIPIIIGVLFGILAFNVVFILWFVAFFDLLKSEFEEDHNKWIWLICFLLLPLITPLFYMLISPKQKRKYSGPSV